MTLVVFADGPDGPLPSPAALAPFLAGDPEMLLGWVVRQPEWISAPGVPVTTLMVGPGIRAAVAAGPVRGVPTRLSAIPRLLAGRLRPDVAVVGAYSAPGSGWRLAGSPGYVPELVESARSGLVIELWPGPPPPWAPILPDRPVLGVLDRTEPPDPAPSNSYGPAHEEIGRLVAGLVPEGATIQWGPGAVGAAVVSALAGLGKPVRVRSGLVTDELADLAEAGLLLGAAVAAYMWGGARLAALVDSGALVLRPISHTHDLTGISAVERFVAINTALQVGLDGAANVEVAGTRTVAGPGGHPDFAAGASRSPGGLSIVALPSVVPGSDGGRSTIVAQPAAVSTPREDVDVVVTEHGVADLRGCTDAERAARLIEVAAPEHREGLRASLRASLWG